MRYAIIKLDDALGRVVEVLAMVILATYASLCLFQVVARFLVDVDATWTETLTRALMVWGVYLGAVALFRLGSLISVDLAMSAARGKWRAFLRHLHFYVSLGVLGFACVFGFQLAWRIRFQVMAGVEVSIAWAYLAIPIGTLLCMLALVARYVDPARNVEPIAD